MKPMRIVARGNIELLSTVDLGKNRITILDTEAYLDFTEQELLDLETVIKLWRGYEPKI